MPAYIITLSGVAGPESDIAKARFYVEGALDEEVNVGPNGVFSFVYEHPGDPDEPTVLQVEHSFVDAAGNESPRFAQSVTVPQQPDLNPPAGPAGPLNLVSVVWA